MDPGRRKEKDCQRWKLQGPALVFGRHECLLEHSWEPASSKGTRMCQRVGDVVYTSMQPPAHAVTLHTLRRRGETVLEGNHLQQGKVWCSLLGLPRAAGGTKQEI